MKSIETEALLEILDAGLAELERRPSLEYDGEEGTITVRAGAMPKGIGVRPETIPDPSETTAKNARLYVFTREQATTARAALRKK